MVLLALHLPNFPAGKTRRSWTEELSGNHLVQRGLTTDELTTWYEANMGLAITLALQQFWVLVLLSQKVAAFADENHVFGKPQFSA